MKLVAKLEDISRSDMIYIYHHISEGIKLDLKKVDNDPSKYIVEFKGFNLGYILLPSKIDFFERKIENIQAIVSKLTKKKYLPIQGMDVELSCAS